MPILRFSPFISTEEYLRYYQGQAVQIAVTTDDGRQLQFPAEYHRPFVLHQGAWPV
ncbi:MAG: DUF2835 family protein [Gammaproteobacteria bacterium]|jgi:hypothetical protein